MDSLKIKMKLFGCQLALLLSFAIFMHGYFPIKESMSGYASHADEPLDPIPTAYNSSTLHKSTVYDRLVIILIDSLRQDFVFSDISPMTFTKSLINDNKTVSFIGRAHPPTVTMPRIKALVGGGVPGFIDVILNIGSTRYTEDNVITQLRRANKTVVFYGDDTWLALFHEHFSRSDGTTSFLVNDFTEVDTNVSRHLTSELQASDWDAMVLHYLGLDHIGHSAGPRSPLVTKKLQEMDRVIERIYTKLILLRRWVLSVYGNCERQEGRERKTVILVCGDHGMSEGGSHGGGTPTETLVPMLLLMPGQPTLKVIYDQIDIVPTLSTFLGLPIPKSSLGVVIPEAITNLDPYRRVRASYNNAHQLLQILVKNSLDIEHERSHELYTHAVESHKRWLVRGLESGFGTSEEGARHVSRQYLTACRAMKHRLVGSLLVYDVYALCVAIGAIAMVLLLLLTRVTPPAPSIAPLYCTTVPVCVTILVVLLHLTVCTSQYRGTTVCGRGVVPVIVQIFSSLLVYTFVSHVRPIAACMRQYIDAVRSTHVATRGLFLASVLHGLSLLASSFVEEEHQILYFYVSTIHTVLLCSVMADYIIAKYRTTNGQNTSHLMKETSNYFTTPANCHSPLQDVAFEATLFNNYTSIDQNNELISNNEELYSNVGRKEYTDNEDITTGSCFHRGNTPLPINKSTDAHISQDLRRKKLGTKSGCVGDDMRTIVDPYIYGRWSTLSGPVCSGREVVGLLCLMILSRMSRSWNQTGDKWINVPDTKRWLLSEDNAPVLTFIVICSLLTILVVRHHRHASRITTTLLCIGLSACYCFRASNETSPVYSPYATTSKGVIEARIALLCIAGICSEITYEFLTSTNYLPKHTVVYVEKLITAWLLFMCLILRVHNIPLVAMTMIQEVTLCRVVASVKTWPPVAVTLYFLCLAQAAFYYQGNSNKFTTLDMSSTLIAMETYVAPVAAVTLMLVTYAGFSFWILSLVKAIVTQCANVSSDALRFRKRLTRMSLDVAWTLTVTRAVPILMSTIAATIHRYHLFVWTVFSPKLFYEFVLTVVLVLYSSIMMLVCRI